MKTLITALCGAASATILILACSDDSPPDADAAVCDCPAAEAPIQGRVMQVVGSGIVVPPSGAAGGAIARCPSGAILLSGKCAVDEPDVRDITLRAFGKDAADETYVCTWLNNHSQQQMVHAEATCLVPAQ